MYFDSKSAQITLFYTQVHVCYGLKVTFKSEGRSMFTTDGNVYFHPKHKKVSMK